MKLRESFASKIKHYRLSLVAILLASAFSAHAEFVFSVFTAKTIDEDNDVKVKQPGGTDLTFHSAKFQGKDFESPQYYGLRAAYFLHEDRSGLGFGIEFFHDKEYMRTSGSLHVTGTRGGVPVNDNEPVDNTIQNFNNSHGMNFLMADVFYRWVFADTHCWVLRHLRPYVGAGAGVVIPHVESEVLGVSKQQYEIGGPGVQAILGLDIKLTKYVSLFTEYKFTYADLDESIPGGSISFQPMTHHFVGGLAFHF
jgi:lipid A oxidase